MQVNNKAGITEEFCEVYKLLDKFTRKTYKDEDEPLTDIVTEIDKVYRNRSIKIPISEEELQRLINGETFDWNFEGVAVHLYQGEEEEE